MKVGTFETRILVATVGDDPTEIATFEAPVRATARRNGVELNYRGWRLRLAYAFILAAWATVTMRDSARSASRRRRGQAETDVPRD
ncbi:hypothetical protein ACWGOE_07315 [Leucobacter chromiiresistens]